VRQALLLTIFDTPREPDVDASHNKGAVHDVRPAVND
jgi:hypothetical protein